MSDGNITRSSKRNKKYRPKFAQVVPKLPSIESFQLDTILNDTLKAESQQVVNHLLDVTTNYQNDLRNEIKHKLSIEQKIQYKNIQIVKLCNSLIRVLAHRRKKLHKTAIPDSDPGINQLLISCVDVSDRIKLLTTKLSRIDMGDNKLDGGKYPNLYKLMHPNDINIETERGDQVEREEEPHTGGDIFQHIDQQILTNNVLTDQENTTKNDITDPNSNSRVKKSFMNTDPSPCDPNSLRNTPKNSNENGDIPQIKTSTNSPISLKVSDDVDHEIPSKGDKTDQKVEAIDPKDIQDQDQDIEIDNMDPEGFELFISSSIGKYRSLQSKKYESSDPFRQTTNSNFEISDPQNDLISDDPSVNSIQTDSKKTFHIMNNPINLLHSSLISNPNYTNILPINETSHPFANLISVKSPATIKLTLQTSHFKKLRINGSPITSESLRKAKNRCQCTDTKPGDKDDTKTDETKKEVTKTDDNTSDPKNNSINESPVSPARKLLADSLLAIDSLRLSDDDAWNSSGLNTETDEDLESDPELSSNSSDSSLNSEQSASVAQTNQYYTSLQTELKHKKKLLRQSILRRRRRHARKNIQRNELSPTPKHEPSHHTLKPKGSILKTNLANYRNTKKPVPMNFDNKYSEERSGISALNNAYDSTTKHEVSGMNVAGTIIQMEQGVDEYEDSEVILWNGKQSQYPDTSDVHNIRSISRLKEYIV